MKTRSALLLAVATLLAGFALGVLFGASGSAPPAPAHGSPSVAAGGDEPAPERADIARRAAPATTPADARPGDFAISEATLARARDGAASIESVRGAATGGAAIRGRVLSRLGAAIEGAVIVASLHTAEDLFGQDPSAFERGADGPSLDEVLADRASAWAKGRQIRGRSISGPDGAFVIDGLPDGFYRLTAHHPEWRFANGDQHEPIAAGSRHDLTGDPLARRRIDIRMPDGTPPAVAAVEVRQAGHRERFRWTSEEATLPLREVPGTIVVEADFVASPAYASIAVPRLKSPSVRFDAGTPTISVELRPTSGIYGTARDPSNGRAYLRNVRLVDVAGGVAPNAAAFGAGRSPTRSGAGAFAFLDLQPGKYAIGVLSSGDALLVDATVTVGTGLVEQILEVPPLALRDALRVRCIGPDGEPVHDVALHYQVRNGDEERDGRILRPMRDETGAYWLRLTDIWSPTGNLPAGATIQIRGSHPRLGVVVGEVPAATRELTLQFESPCALEVEVQGHTSNRHRGALAVFATSKAISDEPPRYLYGDEHRRAEVLEDGTARLDELSPGAWWVQLVRSNDRSSPIGGIVVDVRPPQTRCTLALPQLHELVFECPDVEIGTYVWVSPVDPVGTSRYRESIGVGADLRAVFRDVPAGTYRVQGSMTESRRDIVVPGGPYRLERQRIDCLRVAISDPDGLLRRAGLQAGDLVTAVNGVAITANTWWEVLYEEGSRQNVPLTVLRDGATLTIQGGDHGWAGEDDELGGGFSPASRSDR